MSDDNSEKPDPIEDVRKGLGLLFRAAKGALDQLPTRQVEDAVLSGAREVGRAIENVTGVIDKQFFKRDAGEHAEGAGPTEAKDAHPADAPAPEGAKAEPPHPPDDEPKGPRVA
jgi:hypothetical protein